MSGGKKVGISDLLIPSKIDHFKVTKILMDYVKCESCNPILRKTEGTRCDPCIYVGNSTGYSNESGEHLSRIGCSSKIFGDILGTGPDSYHIGKTYMIYFHNHPELYYQLPKPPKKDFFGEPGDRWELHHYLNPYNDKYVVRVTKSEHPTFEAMLRRGDTHWLHILLMTRERHPSLDIGKIMSKDDLKEYYSCWKKTKDGTYVIKDGRDPYKYFLPYFKI